jgi:hypothetical protein
MGEPNPIGFVDSVPDLDPADRHAIVTGNGERLFAL